MADEDRRESVEGVEREALDLPRAVSQGNRGLALKLAGAGA